MLSPDSISILMPTFGRIGLLEEAIEGFLRQDWTGDMELLIVNDLPGVKLKLDLPRIRVLNLDQRYSSFGAKANAMVQMAKHDWFWIWCDDDVFLPWAVSSLEKHRNEIPEYLVVSGYYYLELNKIHVWMGSQNTGCGLIHRKLFDFVGGYPDMTTGEDQQFYGVVQKLGRIRQIPFTMEESSLLYRWGTGSYHMSAWGWGRGWDESMQSVTLEPGEYQLNPHWDIDYVDLVKIYALQQRKE